MLYGLREVFTDLRNVPGVRVDAAITNFSEVVHESHFQAGESHRRWCKKNVSVFQLHVYGKGDLLLGQFLSWI